MDLSIRPATGADIPAVLDFWLTAAAEPSVSDDADGVGALLARDPEALLIAEVDGTLVGTLAATWDGWRGHLYRLAVAPSARRNGVARALVAAAERRLVGLGARKIQGLVLTHNDTAREFWTAVGYGWDERIARHVKTLVGP